MVLIRYRPGIDAIDIWTDPHNTTVYHCYCHLDGSQRSSGRTAEKSIKLDHLEQLFFNLF